MADGNATPMMAGGESVRFELESDDAPAFWQYLNGLAGDDLLVELVVNDLDAGATMTEIRFEADRLVCRGNGQPVDEDGWKRLRLLRGAGRKAPAKKGLFGIKNHGLKACFTIGNDIVVRSAGKQILQTLFADGPGQPAYPGVRRPPIDDPGAPMEGTQLEVYYRRKAFRAPDGEPFDFGAATDAALDATFLEAVRDFPKRLLGIIRPIVLETYELHLHHHRLGRATLRFKCGRWAVQKGVLKFGRACHVEAGDGLPAQSVHERAFAKSVRLGAEADYAAYFGAARYRGRDGKTLLGKRGLVVEVACQVSDKGRLLPSPGKLRYPISYYGDVEGARSGFALEYSAPFRSDAERHELGTQSKAWNDGLVEACDTLAAIALGQALLPRHGPEALKLISEGADEDRLCAILAPLVRARAMPVVDTSGKPAAIQKGKLLVVPSYAGTPGTWSRKLALVCPPGTALIDPRTPAPVVELVASGKLPGWDEDHLRFDEGDVMDRLQRHDAKYFPWQSHAQWQGALGNGDFAAAHLDALQPVLAAEDAAKRRSPAGVHLPDTAGTLHPFPQLKRGVSLPPGLLDVDPPPSLHPAIKGHPVFRLEGWRPGSFGFSDLLASGHVDALSLAARRRFLSWLADNPGEPGRDDWPALKALPIWASTSGELVLLDQLCKPRDARLAATMADYILRPSREVLRLCRSVDSERVRLRVREEPTPDEIATYVRARLGSFPRDGALPIIERARFHAFEAELLALGVEGRAAAALGRLRDEAVGLDLEGRLRPLGELVRPTPAVDKLSLPAAMVLDRPAVELDRVLPPMRAPTWQMVARTLRDEPGNTSALLPRLRAICDATADPHLRRTVEDIPCIPHGGRLFAPRDLAFKGNAGDFWGRWKTVVSGKALPDDVQGLYREAGVIRSLPDARTSREFLAWLSAQPPSTVAEHMPQVIRHIAYGKAATAWWLSPPESPCVPVETLAGAELLTVSDATKRAVVDDFPQLAVEMRASSAPPPMLLAIDAAKTSVTPIVDELLAFGIPSLRHFSTGPHRVTCEREIAAPQKLEQLLAALKSEATARQLRKQLREFDVRGDILETRWQHKLAAVGRVRVGVGVRAEYKVRRRSYFPQMPWAVVSDAREFWLEDGPDLEAAFYGAVSELIFSERHRYLPLVLRAALEVRVLDFHRPLMDLDDDLEQDPDNAPSDENEEPGESSRPHPGGEPDLTKNRPSPRPLWPGGSGKVRPRSKSSSPPRPQVVDEDVQRRQLKEEHYAWHCQVALASAAPAQLGPPGSYAEFQENRQKMVEAHHPDKVTAGGARNAGNLLILSHLNHERYGRAISRQQVTDALLSKCTPRTILDQDGGVWARGVVAQVVMPSTGEVVAVFFTHDHRSYWLRMAGHPGIS